MVFLCKCLLWKDHLCIGRTMSSDRGDQALALDLDSIYRTGEVVGDAWSWLVMRESVLYDVRRFSQFQARLGVARSTLAARLRQLTSGGLLTEHPRASGPEYHPTESGRDFLACLMAAMRWGDRWHFEERSRPTVAIHVGCGQPLEAILRCDNCRKMISARDVTASQTRPFHRIAAAGPTTTHTRSVSAGTEPDVFDRPNPERHG